MRSIVHVAVALSLLVVASGCDYLEKFKDKEPTPAEKAREAERRADETAEFRAGMARFVEGKLRLAKESLRPLEKTLLDMRKDVDDLTAASTAAMGEKDAKGEELSIESRTLHLMRNTRVNELATRYLKTDFSRDSAAFVECVRLARVEERRYFEALKKADVVFAESLDEFSKWQSATKEQRDSEIERLKKEITSLEASRATLLKESQNVSRSKMKGSVQQERERLERINVLEYKVGEMDSEIKRKRFQVDALRNPDNSRSVETRAASVKQEMQQRANSLRERTLRDINLHLKPKRMVVDIVQEYEGKTVRALQKVMAEELSKCEKQVDAIKGKVRQLEEASLLVPVSGREDLVNLRKSLKD